MKNEIRKVFVSGCYDILHAGHIAFLKAAKALGDYLTVCYASDEVLFLCKGRISSIPEDQKAIVIGSLQFVDRVVKSSDVHPIFDFVSHIKIDKPDILVITDDDKHQSEKKKFCDEMGIELVVLSKKDLGAFSSFSTSLVLRKISGKTEVPLRVDFAGGWLDVPHLARRGSYIVNCTISPLVSLDNWPYHIGGGLGGSAAKSILDMRNGMRAELTMGVGWQDPAVIEETGLCVWRSGEKPVLEAKFNPDWLNGKMAIFWTGSSHYCPDLLTKERNYFGISVNSYEAFRSVHERNLNSLANTINMSYKIQIQEGMESLPNIHYSIAKKYLGGGHGGYALYLFRSTIDRDSAVAKNSGMMSIEPYIKDRSQEC
jgi:cytidyltransferase-like protein